MANQKVSLDEIRARRLAKETKNAATEAQESVNLGGSALGGLTTEDLTAPAAASAPSTVATSPIVPIVLPDLDAMLSAASPEQLQKIRMLAAIKGLTATDVAASRKLPDGSMMVAVQLDGPTVEQLELWAEADGCSLVEEAQKRISEALTNYLYGDWNPVIEQPPAAAATK